MKKKTFIILVITFNVLLLGTLFFLNYVLRNKEFSGAQDRFRAWNPESADVVFVGNSHQFFGVNPDILYSDYDIESFMLATSAQTVPESYYAAMEAIELKHPEKIAFEISYVANDFRTVSSEMDHCFFDGMPLCRTRRLAINDLIDDENKIYYYLPLGLYHVRWKELKSSDFEEVSLSERGTYTTPAVFENWAIPVINSDEQSPMPTEMEKYFLKLIDLCKENNTELILYVLPFNSLYEDEDGVSDLYNRQRIFNYACDLATENGVRAYNFFYSIDEIGLDPSTDWADSQHLSTLGQEKFTRFLVNYLN